jgi:hypothetical protein
LRPEYTDIDSSGFLENWKFGVFYSAGYAEKPEEKK